ncbi:MAG: hypothetical protein ACLSVD_02415 [Eggerthellaceae bacterium]
MHEVLLSAVLACALLIPVTAEEAHASDQPRIVKVRLHRQRRPAHKNDDGTYEGYTYDYLMRIAQFTGWSFEFVEAEGDNANERALRLLEMLDNGEVDIEEACRGSAALAKPTNTPKTAATARPTRPCSPRTYMPPSRKPICSPAASCAWPSSPPRRNAARARVLLRSERHTTNHRRMLLLTRDAGQDQCGRGGRVSRYRVNAQDGFHIIASFAERPFFFAAPKGDREIIDEISATIEHINEGNPQLQNNLYKSTS